jgi:hypothetical protein
LLARAFFVASFAALRGNRHRAKVAIFLFISAPPDPLPNLPSEHEKKKSECEKQRLGRKKETALHFVS